MTPSAAFLLAFLGLGSSPGDSTLYRPPLDIRSPVSSTFAEFRDGHFHAGIDFGTYRRRGYRVRAVAPGYVWRVKTSPVGYGKALYLKLDNGNYAVYAHLSRYSREITQKLWEVQEREGTYHVDAYFPADALPVERGDVVAYTGDTGAGGPHLHFELRDSTHCPINPLLNGFPVTDSTPPMVRRVALVPLDAKARIDGELARKVVYFRVTNGELVQMSTPVIWGRIGVEAWAYDHVDSSGNRVGVHGLELEVDGHRVFGLQYDRFSYEEFYQLYIHYDRALRQAWKGDYARLHRLPWDKLPFHAAESGTGILAAGTEAASNEVHLTPGRHALTVVGRDVSGNVRSANVQVVVNAPPDVSLRMAPDENAAVARIADPSGGIADVDFFVSRPGGSGWQRSTAQRRGQEWWLRLDDPPPALVRVVAEDSLGMRALRQERWTPAPSQTSPPAALAVTLALAEPALRVEARSEVPLSSGLSTLLYLPGGHAVALSLETTDYRSFRAAVPLVPAMSGTVRVTASGTDINGDARRGEASLLLQPLSPWQRGVSVSSDSLAGLAVQPGDLHYLVYPTVERTNGGSTGELLALGHAYEIGPREATFARGVRVFVRLPEGEDPTHVGLFRKKGSTSWGFEGSSFDELGRGEISASVRELGTFALLRDTEAPRVSSVRPYAGQVVGAKPRLEAAVADRGSGIDYVRSHLELDGRRVVTQYVPERSRLVGHLGSGLSAGDHRLVVRAWDKTGNERAVDRSFRVR
jgi:murein DD-endopeptidase MepM/ murein hydrolase activator NlpD